MRAAIVGLGRWGQVLVNSVQGRSERIRFVAAATGRPERAADFAERQRIEVLPDLDAILTRDDIDAVVLATPHSQHGAQIVAASAQGRPVLCEKPLTLTLAEARTAWDAADAAGVLLAAAHNRRFLPAYRRLLELVQSNHLGEILQVFGNHSWAQAGYTPDHWRSRVEESPAGGMAGLGIHVVDAMMGLGLRAEAVRVMTRGEDLARPRTLTAAIDFDSGAIGLLTTINGPGRTWRIEVLGSEGRAAMDGEGRLIYARAGAPETRIDFGGFDKEAAELEAFAEAVGGGAPWPVTRDEGLAGIALFEAICTGATTPDERQPVARTEGAPTG
ncbi:Gfo/Idh/MocA family oxidoreductase [Pararhodobacter sp. SW119]|uniref:Gfo/Idh/MocA family protein n=1 Tax=Pararhodobacter sp. SW119 TaxID=2780075 RepID=UPI001AE05D8F|nr:Gfo/Idh/MocA family oxidoreductase [Pararhodobacter sp. SW119]